MTPDTMNYLPLRGSHIRVVYSIDGLEMFALGVLAASSGEHITVQQYADQYGPVGPFQLTIQWSNIIRLTVNGPAVPNCPPGAWGT